MPHTEPTLKIAKEIKEKLDKLSLIRKKSSEGLVEEAISRYIDLELWRHDQIMQGLDESKKSDYANEEDVKRVFKKMFVNWTKSALKDIEIEANYLNKINPSIRDTFLDDVESSINLVKKYPELGRIGRVSQTRELIL